MQRLGEGGVRGRAHPKAVQGGDRALWGGEVPGVKGGREVLTTPMPGCAPVPSEVWGHHHSSH